MKNEEVRSFFQSSLCLLHSSLTSLMVKVFIPPLLRDAAGGVDHVEVSATTVRQVVAALEARFPGMLAADGHNFFGIGSDNDIVKMRRGPDRLVDPTDQELASYFAQHLSWHSSGSKTGRYDGDGFHLTVVI